CVRACNAGIWPLRIAAPECKITRRIQRPELVEIDESVLEAGFDSMRTGSPGKMRLPLIASLGIYIHSGVLDPKGAVVRDADLRKDLAFGLRREGSRKSEA